MVSGGGEWELIYSEVLDRKFDFSKNGYLFRMKVFAPRVGVKVYFKLEPPQLGNGFPPAVEVTNVSTTRTGQWEELTFDFTSLAPANNEYQKIILLFDAGDMSSGENWYFDDIIGPSDDLSDIALFKRCLSSPVFAPDRGWNNWRSFDMANAAILTPELSPNQKWCVYIRGSGNRYSAIGLYYQEPASFNPLGPWTEYPDNPVIRNEVIDQHLIDCAPVVGKDGVLYHYYNDVGNGLGVAVSTDGGYTFTKPLNHPVQRQTGCSDAVYHNEKYYIFHGNSNGNVSINPVAVSGQLVLYVAVTDDPLSVDISTTYKALDVGGGPDNFDSYAVNGSRIFRLKGVEKWFMVYQGSAVHFDFPCRFHVAYSDDLIHWTKVSNHQPFFTRGKEGRWDQGGIWYGSLFEYEDKLYLYYEGYGCEQIVPNRNIAYFANGYSSTGVASATKADFLKWCGM